MGERIVGVDEGAGSRSQLELPGSSPAGEPVGIGVEQHRTGAIGVDRSFVERQSSPTSDVGGTGTDAVHSGPVGAVVALAGDDPESQGEIDGQFVGAPAQDVSLVEQRCHRAGQRRRIGDHHPRQARMERQAHHPSPDVGDLAVGVQRVELGEQLGRLGERSRRRRIEEGE